MMEKPLAALRQDLAALGVARQPRAGLPEDHLGALCETMRLLVAGAPGRPAAPLDRQCWFFRRHLEGWPLRCLADIEAAAPARFYRTVSGFVRAFLVLEQQAFELMEPDGRIVREDGSQAADPGRRARSMPL